MLKSKCRRETYTIMGVKNFIKVTDLATYYYPPIVEKHMCEKEKEYLADFSSVQAPPQVFAYSFLHSYSF